MSFPEHRTFLLTNAGLAVIWIIVLAVIVGTLSVSVGYLFGQQLVPDIRSSEEGTPKHTTAKDALKSSKTDLSQYEYLLSEDFSFQSPDRQLLRRARGETATEVVVKSINALGGISADEKFSFAMLAEPASGTKFWLTKIRPQTDASASEVWEFDIAKGTIKKLPTTSAGLTSPPTVSPDKFFAVVVPGGDDPAKIQTLNLLDFARDKVSRLVTVKGNETLSRGIELGHLTKIAWKDEKTVQYTVYDSSKSTGDGLNSPKLFTALEERTVRIDSPAQ